MKKRVLALLFAFVLLITSLPANVLAFNNGSSFEVLENLKAQTDDLIKDENEVHTFIVQVEDGGSSVRPYSKSFGSSNMDDMSAFKAAKSKGQTDDFIQQRLDSQDLVLERIFGYKGESTRSSYDMVMPMSRSSVNTGLVEDSRQLSDFPRYVAVLNGFALKMTLKEAKEVALIDGVSSISPVVEYQKPKMRFSREIVNAPKSVSRGYDGTGRVIAILDTGIDVNHQDLRLDNDKLALAKYDEAGINQLIASNKLLGKYATAKVPYVYNYADRDTNMMTPEDNHGQHIAGTIAGNGDVSKDGVVGIVPNAQILGMRVFGAGNGFTNTSIYTEAIDDAVILGADAINMSLGSYAGAATADKVLDLVIKRANDAGSIVTFAGGNDGYSMSAIGETSAEMVDFSTLGSPGATKEVFTVASYNNTNILESYIILAKNDEGKEVQIRTNPGSSIATAIDTGFKNGVFYDFIAVGLGNTEADYAGQDAKGKVVIAQRGGATFTEKAQLAQEMGAIAIIIGDNKDDKVKFTMSMDDGLIPSFYVWKEDYERLINFANKQVAINQFGQGELLPVENTGSGKMSDFSSWGPTPNLAIKPEITAPGGDIRSIDNLGAYIYMSGTSMATPHVVGGIAAVNGSIKDMNLEKAERSEFIKKLIMNTAQLIKVPGTDDYYSVRLQGAGMMDLDAATNGKFVTIEDNNSRNESYGSGKIELRQIKDTKLPIDLKIVNYTEEEIVYDVYSVIQTDKTSDGIISMDMSNYSPRTIQGKTKIGEVTLAPNGEATYSKTLTYDDSSFSSEFEKGYFVEGFVILEPRPEPDGGTTLATLSIPYMAFKGNWYEDVPIIESFIDQFDLVNDFPFWVENAFVIDGNLNEEELDKANAEGIDATFFYSNHPNILSGQANSEVLGRDVNGDFTDKFAISPNADQSQDALTFKGVFLRNYDNFHMLVKDESGTAINKIHNIYRQDGRKSAFTIDMKDPITSTTNGNWTWDGKNWDGNVVPEGTYTIDVNARIQDAPDAPLQTVSRKVIVDITNPKVEEASIKLENGGIVASAKVSDELSGVKAVYLIDPNTGNYYLMEENNGVWEYRNNEITSVDGLFIKAIDWAGNTQTSQAETGTGKLVITKVNPKAPKDIPTNIIQVFKVDDKNNKISEAITDLTSLADGKYIAEFKDKPANYLISFEPSQTFDIVDGSTAEITFKFEKVDTNDFGKLSVNLIWPADYDGAINVFAKDAEGNVYELSREYGFSNNTYSVDLPAGNYEVYVEGNNGKVNVVGPRQVMIVQQKNSVISLRVAEYGNVIKFYFETEDLDLLYDWFKKEDVEIVTGVDENGEEYTDLFLHNFFDYFEIYDMDTHTSLKEADIDLFSESDPNVCYFSHYQSGSYNTTDFFVKVPYGVYEIIPKIKDINIYKLDKINLTGIEPGNDWVGFTLYEKSDIKGKITANTSFVPGEIVKDLDVVYNLYDIYGNMITPTSENVWEKLSEGTYTLEVISNEKEYVPEKTSYVIVVENAEPIVQDVRFKNITTDPIKRFSSMAIGIYGDNINELGEVRFIFRDKKTGEKVTEIRVNPGSLENLVDELVPFGSYEVEVDMNPEFSISGLFLSTNDFRENSDDLYDNKTKFDMVISTSYNEIEIKVANKTPLLSSIDIVETNDGGDVIYVLRDLNGKLIAKSNDDYFKSVPNGKYFLEILTEGDKVVDKVILNGKELSRPYMIEVKDNNLVIEVSFKSKPVIPSKPVEPKPEEPSKPVNDNYPTVGLEEFIFYPDQGIGGRTEYPQKPTERPEVKEEYGLEIPKESFEFKLTDVSPADMKAVEFLVKRGILKGMDDNKFEGEVTVTRAMVVETLMRLSKDKSIDYENKFNDVKADDWFYDSVRWAAQRKIVLGDDLGNFNPNDKISRQEFALVIDRFLKSNNVNMSKVKEFTYTDKDEIPSWSIDSVVSAVEKSLVLGKTEDKYEPESEYSRSELARTLYEIAVWLVERQ